MSSAQLLHAIRVCEQIVEQLPQVPQKVIQAAEVSIQAAVPPFWPTYKAGITRRNSAEEQAIVLDAGLIEGAVHPSIVAWAQKVFSAAGMAPPTSAHDYVYDEGGAYPLRIEQQGSPEYPGNRAVGKGEGVWKLAALEARKALSQALEAMQR